MKKLLVFFLLVCIAFGLCRATVGCGAESANLKGNKRQYNFLILGFDDAQKNTDAIIIASYDTSINEARFLQIPRDTLVVYSGKDIKINGIYPSLISEGMEPYLAAQELSGYITSTFGIAIDGFVGFSVDAFSRLIDHIGGIDIEIPYDFIYNNKDGNVDISIPKGKHHLSGEEAVRFVRYRRGYSIGDLGRLDAQKLFISAFVTKLKSSINPATALRMMCDSGEGVITNIRLTDILGIALKKNGRLVDAGIKYSSLPGMAGMSRDKVSYFVGNKRAIEELLSKLNISFGDRKINNLCSKNSLEFVNIFNATNINARIYDDRELSTIVIP